MSELNLNDNIKRLILIAIKKYDSKVMQASSLGLSTRTFYNYRKRFNLEIELSTREKRKLQQKRNVHT